MNTRIDSQKLAVMLQRADNKRRDRRTKPRPAARKMRAVDVRFGTSIAEEGR